ncbi:hypothetical protein R3I94_016668 [Phoxinus phoxinus]
MAQLSLIKYLMDHTSEVSARRRWIYWIKYIQGLDDEMAPKMCGTTNPPFTTDDTEELTTESKCTHTAVSHPNQTSPELSPCTKVGEGLDDEMAPKMCGTTNPPFTTDDTEELTTESKCTHTAVSHPNQTSPELSPCTKVGECQKHCLVCATVSSLDKRVRCVGPVSSFKWLGYQCTGVWHKSCLKQIKRDDFNSTAQAQQSPKASDDELLSDQDKIPHPALDQISSDDAEDMSDKEYIPDSESEYSLSLLASKGNLCSIQGKSLDEIEIEDEIALSDAEDWE